MGLFSNPSLVQRFSTSLGQTSGPTPLKPLVCALLTATAITAMSGCKSDNVGKVRIIEQPKKDAETDIQKTLFSSPFSANGQVANLYDATNAKDLGSATFTTAEKPADSDKPTTTEQGAAVQLSVKKSDIKTDALVLVTYSLKAQQNYYDPVLGKQTRANSDKQLYALASSASLTNAKASPYTTLAYFRALARAGWFYDHEALPNQAQLSEFLRQPAGKSLGVLYGAALAEIKDTFGDNQIPMQVNTLEDLKPTTDFAKATSTDLIALASTLRTLAQFGVANDVFASQTPYYDIAYELASDFFDGDIDGRTLRGSKRVLSKVLLNAPENTNPKNNFVITKTSKSDTKTNGGIYDAQKATLEAYEVKYREKLVQLIGRVGITDAPLKESLLKPFDTSGTSKSRPEQIETVQVGKPLTISYSDYRAASLSNMVYTVYQGIGNKKLAFGFSDNSKSQNFLGASASTLTSGPYSGITPLSGRYENTTGCTLTVLQDGALTISQNGMSHTALLDRTLNDNLARKTSDATDYKLNIFSKESDASLSRVIQLDIVNGKVAGAASQIVQSAGADALSAPDINCRF